MMDLKIFRSATVLAAPAVAVQDLLLTASCTALSPIVELVGRHTQPSNEPPGADLGLLRPPPEEIHDLVPQVMRHRAASQSSPTVFLGQHAPSSVRPKPVCSVILADERALHFQLRQDTRN